jgi:hypothetical protein
LCLAITFSLKNAPNRWRDQEEYAVGEPFRSAEPGGLSARLQKLIDEAEKKAFSLAKSIITTFGNRSPRSGNAAMPLLRLALLGALLVLLGCVGVPKQELDSYRTAYSEAKNAGELLYDEISGIISAQNGGGSGGCSSSAGAFPKCFNPLEVTRSGRRNEDASILARRLSLALLEEYNTILLDLAEGKSQADIKRNIEGLAGLANDLLAVSGVTSGGLAALLQGPVVGALSSFALKLEGLRANEAVRQALIADRPTISALFEALISDTPKMYEIFKAHQIGQWNAAQKAHGIASPEAKRELDRIGAFHSALAAYVNLLEATRKSHSLLADSAASRINSIDDIRSFVAGAIDIRQSAAEFWNKIREVRN